MEHTYENWLTCVFISPCLVHIDLEAHLLFSWVPYEHLSLRFAVVVFNLLSSRAVYSCNLLSLSFSPQPKIAIMDISNQVSSSLFCLLQRPHVHPQLSPPDLPLTCCISHCRHPLLCTVTCRALGKRLVLGVICSSAVDGATASL